MQKDWWLGLFYFSVFSHYLFNQPCAVQRLLLNFLEFESFEFTSLPNPTTRLTIAPPDTRNYEPNNFLSLLTVPPFSTYFYFLFFFNALKIITHLKATEYFHFANQLFRGINFKMNITSRKLGFFFSLKKKLLTVPGF